MEKIEQRAMQLRKLLKMSQMDFGKSIGLKQSVVSKWEVGAAPVTDHNIKMICLTFDVREDWLRNGIGEIYEKDKNPIIKELEELFKVLSPASQKMILNLARDMYANEQEDTAPPDHWQPLKAAGDSQ